MSSWPKNGISFLLSACCTFTFLGTASNTDIIYILINKLYSVSFFYMISVHSSMIQPILIRTSIHIYYRQIINVMETPHTIRFVPGKVHRYHAHAIPHTAFGLFTSNDCQFLTKRNRKLCYYYYYYLLYINDHKKKTNQNKTKKSKIAKQNPTKIYTSR